MAQKYAMRCFLLAVSKIAIALLAAAATEFVPFLAGLKETTLNDGVPMVLIVLIEATIGVVMLIISFIGARREETVPNKRRRNMWRLIGAATIADSVSILISSIWPTQFDLVLTIASAGLGALAVIALGYASSSDDGPRRKRKPFKAKWPAWVKKRWSAARPLPRPQPAPRPAPGRA